MMKSDDLNEATDYRAAIGAAAGSFLLMVAGTLSVYLLWIIKEAIEIMGR